MNTTPADVVTAVDAAPKVAASILWAHIGLAILSMSFSIYVGVSFVWMEIKQRRCTSSRTMSRNERVLSIASRVTCLAAMVLSLASGAFTILELLASNYHYFGLEGLQNQATCNSIISAWILLAGTTCVYMFLWIRQRVFYVNPALKHLGGFTLESISYLIIIAWVGYFFYGSITVFGYFRMIYLPGMGCRLRAGSAIIAWRFFLSWVLACSCMQACLLSLFIYPLLRRRCFAEVALTATNKALYRRVVKATCLTLFCIATDVLAYLTFYVFSNGTFPIYTLNLTVNVCTIVLCFDFWKEVLIPCNISVSKIRLRKSRTRSTISESGEGTTSSSRTTAI